MLGSEAPDIFYCRGMSDRGRASPDASHGRRVGSGYPRTSTTTKTPAGRPSAVRKVLATRPPAATATPQQVRTHVERIDRLVMRKLLTLKEAVIHLQDLPGAVIHLAALRGRRNGRLDADEELVANRLIRRRPDAKAVRSVVRGGLPERRR